MKRTFLVKKDPTIEAQDNWLIMDYRQYAAWRETDEGKNREIVFGKFEACSEDDSIIFMECNEKVSKELKKDCHRKQYIRSRDAETPFQVMSYSTMTFQESEIYGEDVLEDTECNVEESVMAKNTEQPPIRCSFCGKRENQASRLIAGPGVYICSDCVAACSELLR